MRQSDTMAPRHRALPTLVVVEPNAKGVGGHYLDYVLSFAEALGELGVKARMLASRDADPNSKEDFLIPTFSFGFWDGYPRPSEVLPGQVIFRALSRFGLLWRIALHLYYHPLTTTWVHRRRRSLRGLVGRLLAAPLLGLNWFNEHRASRLNAIYQFSRTWRAQRKLVSTSVRELEAELKRLGDADTILFFTTAGENELRMATRVLMRRPRASAILMVRRPLFYLSSGGDFDALLYKARRGRLAKEISRARRLVGRRIQYVTDTEELTSLHNMLGLARFTTLPIPHIVTQQPRRDQDRIKISYLGDARTEKGFLHLPRIADVIAASPFADRVELFVQCNFNIPGGEPGIPEALAELRQARPGLVKLQNAPLERIEYIEQLSRSDIMLLLYDRDLYRHRSSGIVVEALSAGATPIIPSGSWLESACKDVLAADRAIELLHYAETSRTEVGNPGGAACQVREGAPLLRGIDMGRILDDGSYRLAGQSRGHLIFGLPDVLPDALDVSFSTGLLDAGHIFDVELTLLDAKGETLSCLSRQQHIFGVSPATDSLDASDRFSQIVAVREGCRFLRIGFGNTFGQRDLSISSIRVSCMRRVDVGTLPSRGALLFGDIAEVPGMLLEEIKRRLLDSGARHQSWRGSQFHNPRTFSQMLLTPMRRI